MIPITSACTICCAAEGHSVALVDIPGFNGTYHSDVKALTDVVNFLAQIYLDNLKLAGVNTSTES